MERIFKEIPKKYIQARVTRIEKGTASVTIKVVIQRLRKKNKIVIAKTAPSIPDLNNSFSELMIPSAWFHIK